MTPSYRTPHNTTMTPLGLAAFRRSGKDLISHPYSQARQGLITRHPSISFRKHCNNVSDRIDKRNNMLKALAGSSWGHDKEILLMTYNALGKSIANYAAPVWSTNVSDSSFKKIQTAQNAALRTATGAQY